MIMNLEHRELLFSYGTLQQEDVQLAQFGRRLEGESGQLLGYRRSQIEITDPEVLAKSGKRHHPIAYPTGDPSDIVVGTVFRVSEGELVAADAYEVSDYHRVAVHLSSGVTAWAYVGCSQSPRAE